MLVVYRVMSTWNELVDDYRSGDFDPRAWTWCIGANTVPVSDDTERGWHYEPRTCVYIMGTGGENLYQDFTMKGEGPEWEAKAKALIRETFGEVSVLMGLPG